MNSPPPRPIRDLPNVAGHRAEIARRLRDTAPAVFLDYDGTLTPIVQDPADASIDDGVREVIRSLSKHCPMAIVSGRDLDDLRRMVAVDGLAYAGSHGFDILAPDGTRTQHAAEYLPDLDDAEDALTAALTEIPGARIERKRFAVAAHYRQVQPERVGDVTAAVNEVAVRHPRLRATGGKMVYELRPDVAWDKGRALLSLLAAMGLDSEDVTPIYIGDDLTDEDAFRVLGGRGLALVVRGEDDDRLTSADYRLDDPAAVVAFLVRLASR